MRQPSTTFVGIHSWSVSPDSNCHEGKVHLQFEWLDRGTGYHPPSFNALKERLDNCWEIFFFRIIPNPLQIYC